MDMYIRIWAAMLH